MQDSGGEQLEKVFAVKKSGERNVVSGGGEIAVKTKRRLSRNEIVTE